MGAGGKVAASRAATARLARPNTINTMATRWRLLQGPRWCFVSVDA